jgi:hypothetical protein
MYLFLKKLFKFFDYYYKYLQKKTNVIYIIRSKSFELRVTQKQNDIHIFTILL